jgi:hypothetical protein
MLCRVANEQKTREIRIDNPSFIVTFRWAENRTTNAGGMKGFWKRKHCR